MSEIDQKRRKLSAQAGMVGMGVLVQGLAAPLTAAAAPLNLAAPRGWIEVDARACTGCGKCVEACTAVHGGDPSRSCIRLDPEHHNLPMVCAQCLQPRCVLVCPMEAIGADENTGARVIDADRCIGCRLCALACPMTPPRTFFHRGRRKSIKCDLCGGDPACVAACPREGIRYHRSNKA